MKHLLSTAAALSMICLTLGRPNRQARGEEAAAADHSQESIYDDGPQGNHIRRDQDRQQEGRGQKALRHVAQSPDVAEPGPLPRDSERAGDTRLPDA